MVVLSAQVIDPIHIKLGRAKDFFMKEINEEKIDEMTLALLYLVTDTQTARAWKSFDWDTMDRLHKKGLISDPMNKNKSVFLSDEALQLSKSLFEKHFLINES